ncbi:MAG: Ig-like domain-containing protein [Proteobacteria bacterium]|nr:Ig-like domain-containing protein [Pseudomonadota bacterium]
MNRFIKIPFLFCCILLFLLAGCKPSVTIIAPANGDTFEVGEAITFEGQATDQLHPDLSEDAFVWMSNKDGEIGTGPSFESSDLTEGEHFITLTVTDPNGQSGQSSINITVKPSCIPPDANDNGDSADDLQAILNKGEDLCLCENQIYNLSTNQCGSIALCYKKDGQQIYTHNFPNAETGTSTAATLRINNTNVTTILQGEFSNIQLKSVILDGNRNNLGYVSGADALATMGFDSSGQIIEHNLFKSTRTWSTIQVFEGSLSCNNITVAYNRMEDAGCDKDGNGCAPGDEAKTWADGISFACQNSSVHDNVIMNATDGGIVLFAPRGSEVYNNTIMAVDRIMLGGINMVDDVTFRITIDNSTYADFSNVQVYGNTIDASGNLIDVGIAQGNGVWFCPPMNNPLHGASVTNNTFQGAYMRWGAAIDGVHDWIFNNNIFNAAFSGPSINSCEGDTIPAANDCRKHAAHITGTNVFQSQCVDVHFGESLHGVLIDN